MSPSFSPPVTSPWTPHLQSLVSIQVFTLPVSSKLFEPPTPIFIILRLSCWASLLQSSCSQLHTKFFPSPFYFTSFKQRISSSINAVEFKETLPSILFLARGQLLVYVAWMLFSCLSCHSKSGTLWVGIYVGILLDHLIWCLIMDTKMLKALGIALNVG
jgi:hypothetical protein